MPKVLSVSYVRQGAKLPRPVHKNAAEHRTEAMQDLGYEFPGISVPHTQVNKARGGLGSNIPAIPSPSFGT